MRRVQACCGLHSRGISGAAGWRLSAPKVVQAGPECHRCNHIGKCPPCPELCAICPLMQAQAHWQGGVQKGG